MSEQTRPINANLSPSYFTRRSIPEPNSGCTLWLGALNRGYGVIYIRRKTQVRALRAHRVAYELDKGPIQEGLVLDHLCRNRACINPTHMEPVTVGENVLRGVGLAAQNAKKMECLRGHVFDEANTYHRRNGWRGCRACHALEEGTRKKAKG